MGAARRPSKSISAATHETRVLTHLAALPSPPVRSPLPGVQLSPLRAMPCDLETLRARLRQWSDHDDKAYQTASTCLDILLQGKGGIIIFVVDEQALVKSEDFPFVYLGNHAFTRILQQTVDNFHTRKEAFGELLDAFCMHNETDRWERQ